MSRKRIRSSSPASQLTFTVSTALEDRGSTFLGLYSATASPRALQSHSSIASATHRIVAWRKASKQSVLPSSSHRQIYETGYDDDGEKWAGKKLETLLGVIPVEGTIVVARWYGGVLLGPVRFAHIERVAREAISKSKTVLGRVEPERTGAHNDTSLSFSNELAQEPDESAAKRRKSERDDQEARMHLINTLEKRDHSISTLRELLAEKKDDERQMDKTIESKNGETGNVQARAKADNENKYSNEGHKRTTRPSVDYSRMSLDVLRRLETVRDTSIAWILKEIDKVENANL